MPRLPTTPRKDPAQLRRRNAPEQWTVLPAGGCDLAAPAWPFPKPSKGETDLWARLWALPVATYWHDQRIEPTIVATYVRLATTKPEHASSLRLMTELGLTPAALQRLRLIVEAPEPEAVAGADPYEHLRAVG